jgi:transposase
MAGQSQLDLHRLVFIDEAGAKTNMTRLYGRAEKGERVVDLAPHGHWCTTTMISSIRLNGTTACMAVDGSTTGDVFRAYTEHVLVPSLHPGDIVVLDNLSAHKDKVSREMIESVGAQVIFLPPYSPDLNPIEKMWSKVKQLLRGTKARTQESLLTAIGVALECVTEADALGWFDSCGYSLN